MNEKKQCPCTSGQPYELCCQPAHRGTPVQTAERLVRARYSAYALNLPRFIIATTHPASPKYVDDPAVWMKQISEFSLQSSFSKLDILDFKEYGMLATVIFVAHLSQHGQDVTFTERSYFEKVRGQWLYRNGQLTEGHAPNLVTLAQPNLLPLAYYGDPILRKKAAPILEITPEIHQLVDKMVETMDGYDGIGLAAPQVHHSLSLFVMRTPQEDAKGRIHCGELQVCINPTLSPRGSAMWKESEGCLSVPSIHVDVNRYREISIEYMDLQGKKREKRCSGWEAKVMQHEDDHLKGIFFFDRLDQGELAELEPFLKRLHRRIHDGSEL